MGTGYPFGILVGYIKKDPLDNNLRNLHQIKNVSDLSNLHQEI